MRRRVFATGIAVIKKLRDLTGAPIIDVKNALEETAYDFDKAFDVLRLKGLAAAAKKASRDATEGLVGVAVSPGVATVIEVNCETDFVARNPKFGQFVEKAAEAVRRHTSSNPENIDNFKEVELENSTIGDELDSLSSVFREKLEISRVKRLESPGEIFTYCHNKPPGDALGVGKIGTVVSIGSTGGGGVLKEAATMLNETHLGTSLAMHIAAMRPLYIDKVSVDLAHLGKETAIARQQAVETKKPSHIIDRIVQGRLNKFYEEVCFLQQKYVLQEGATVQETLAEFAKTHSLPHGLAILKFLRIQCGERR